LIFRHPYHFTKVPSSLSSSKLLFR